ALELLPKVLEIAKAPKDRELLELLKQILRCCQATGDDKLPPLMSAEISADEERRLVQMTHELGHPAAAMRILQGLANPRPDRAELQTAVLEAILVQAKQLLDRCEWHEAGRVLAQWMGKDGSAPPSIRAALLNLSGCCACLNQDFETAVHSFSAALKIM